MSKTTSKVFQFYVHLPRFISDQKESIAFDRYYKICKPMRRLTTRTARYIVLVAAVVATASAALGMYVFGESKRPTSVPGVRTSDCSISDSVQGTEVPVIYYIIFMAYTLMGCFILVVLYARNHLKKYVRGLYNPTLAPTGLHGSSLIIFSYLMQN